ncbi:hypothetical protein CWB99_15805 [Pseudoalteromonas rubra]|uniref:Uncharacterized protein n=1 Tax=Pseudoalteromonas rubra TaxID=43658 RepID=A0A5S3WKG5_9GAMM|nr:hypothetical protein CWB99_15805 [Pseudoalteromonas rubra]TMP29477.1 hypothetical protein CWC00_18900 [Pseudoalteromonas rubra]
MKLITFYIAQCYQRQQSRVLLLVEPVYKHPTFNMPVLAQRQEQSSQCLCAHRFNMLNRFVVYTQPLKQVIKLMVMKAGLHGLLLCTGDDQILASQVGQSEVPKKLNFWNGKIPATALQNGGDYDQA